MDYYNIFMLTSNIINQGTYWRAFEFAKRLVDIGHDVTIIATSQESKKSISVLKQNGITLALMPDLFQGPLRSGWDPYNTLMRISFLKSKKIQIIHAFESRPTVIYPSLISQKNGAKLVMDWCDWFGRGGSVEERPNPLIRTLLRPIETFHEEHFRTRANATTVICTTLRNRAIKLGIQEHSVHLIPNGLNNSNLKYIDKKEARQHLKLNSNLFLIGYIGAIFLNDMKFMAETCNHITKSNINNNVKFIHLGNTNYQLKKYVKEPESVIQTGTIPHDKLNDYLAACDVCWLPLKNTNANNGRFPYKFSDYLTCGKPIISTNVGDIANFIVQENVGMISQDNPEDFAQTTINLLLDDNKLDFFENQALLVSKDPKYSWEEKARQLLEIYRQI